MGKDRQISHAVGFQIIYVDTLPWERWGVTPALPAAAQRGFLHTVGLFQRVNSLERGETSHVTEEEPDKHDLSQGSRSISAEVSHADTSNMICESGSLTPWFSSPRFIIQSNHKKKKKKKKKTPETSLSKDVLQNNWSVLLKTVIQNPEKPSSQEEPKET